ncbi:acyltransferase family protein, partial [Acinetobacter sp. TUM15512]
DLLRFTTAIIMVMLHVQAIMAESFIKYLAYNGFYGTSIFFILSGFILTHVYKNKIIQNKFSNADFLIKRLSALYPIHIFTLLIALSFTLILTFSQSKNSSYFMEIGIQTLPGIISDEKINLSVGDFITYIIESLFLIQAWEFKYLALNAAAWSISTLFFFYLFFKISVKKISKLKKYFLVLFYIWIIYLSIPVFFTYNQYFSSDAIGFIHRNPLIRIPEFISGIILYFIYLSKNNLIKKYRYFLGVIGLSGFIVMGILVKSSPEKWFFVSHNGLFLFPQLALLCAFINTPVPTPQFISLFQRLGKASLSIYMLHLPLLHIYFTGYRLILGFMNSNSLSEVIPLAKEVKNLDSISVILFLFILISISLFIQDKLFTPLQSKNSQKLISARHNYKNRNLNMSSKE